MQMDVVCCLVSRAVQVGPRRRDRVGVVGYRSVGMKGERGKQRKGRGRPSGREDESRSSYPSPPMQSCILPSASRVIVFFLPPGLEGMDREVDSPR